MTDFDKWVLRMYVLLVIVIAMSAVLIDYI